MILDSRKGSKALPGAKRGLRGDIIDLDTGEKIRWAIWADTDSGKYERWLADPEVAEKLGLPPPPRKRGRARLAFIPRDLLPIKPPEEIQEQARPVAVPRKGGTPILAIANRDCQHYACGRMATWKTADEQILSPEQAADGTLYERARLVGVSYWCDWHYRWPNVVHPDGSRDAIQTVKARPD